jgi:hypothetical protein
MKYRIVVWLAKRCYRCPAWMGEWHYKYLYNLAHRMQCRINGLDDWV